MFCACAAHANSKKMMVAKMLVRFMLKGFE
jgi:hypothetical protein